MLQLPSFVDGVGCESWVTHMMKALIKLLLSHGWTVMFRDLKDKKKTCEKRNVANQKRQKPQISHLLPSAFNVTSEYMS